MRVVRRAREWLRVLGRALFLLSFSKRRDVDLGLWKYPFWDPRSLLNRLRCIDSALKRLKRRFWRPSAWIDRDRDWIDRDRDHTDADFDLDLDFDFDFDS